MGAGHGHDAQVQEWWPYFTNRIQTGLGDVEVSGKLHVVEAYHIVGMPYSIGLLARSRTWNDAVGGHSFIH